MDQNQVEKARTVLDHAKQIVEGAKQRAAQQAVDEHFDPAARYIGIGSGTTILYVVEAIKAKGNYSNIQFIPTGYQSRQVIISAGLTPTAFDELPDEVLLDVAFDGADEVDEELNCIKGGGACLFQEKLVAMRAKKFICVADYRKDQKRLLCFWPAIPIEVAPIAAPTVLRELRKLGSMDPKVRVGHEMKTGPIKSDQGFFLIDAPFKRLLTSKDVQAGQDGSGKDGVWEVDQLAHKIKNLVGVLEVGLFYGMNGYEAQAAFGLGGQKPIAVYFGMENGEVKTRLAPELR